MTWIDNILDLQYYKQPNGLPCYCELLVYPNDLILQGAFNNNGSNNTVTLYTYSADGLTQYEDVTSKFDIYIALNPITGQYFFNARLKEWADSMCEHKCFIIRATVTNSGIDFIAKLFDKYTERYCQSECCDEARDITFSQSQVTIPADVFPAAPQNSKKYTECGNPVIRLISTHTCYDPFADVFYGTPDVIISGSASFGFTKVSTFKGRIVRRPQEITRELSYNCRLQRVSSTAQYLLEGFEYFPTWKMIEVQAQLHAEQIFVDDYTTYKQYQFSGGVAFQQINSCFELFKLNTFLQDCEIRKIYGCDTPCGTPSLYSDYQSFFVVPDNYNGGGFYNDQKQLIASDIDTLVDYIRNLNGMTAAAFIYASPADCSIFAVIGFSGNSTLPNSLYYDYTLPSYRVFAVGIEDIEDVCELIPDTCETPEFTILVEDSDCDAPEYSIVITYTEPIDVPITAVTDWTISDAETDAKLKNNQVLMNLKLTSTIFMPTGEVGEIFVITDEIIGIMGADGRPSAPVALTSENSNMPDDTELRIDENGIIRYTGEPTSYVTGGEAHIEIVLTNIFYNI